MIAGEPMATAIRKPLISNPLAAKVIADPISIVGVTTVSLRLNR